MKALRSMVFNIAFYCNIIFWLILAIPLLFFPRKYLFRLIGWWVSVNFWLLEHIAGIKCVFRHTERIPEGGILVASKHQSFWETFALFSLFKDPLFVLKRELMWIPFFGWYLKKLGCIAVEREAGEKSVRIMLNKARDAIAQQRQVIIFPEGTRTSPGDPPSYKRGVELLYRMLKVSCVPIALNSGLFWPRRRFIRHPGTIIVEICPLIDAGLKGKEFSDILQARIESEMPQLLNEDTQKS